MKNEDLTISPKQMREEQLSAFGSHVYKSCLNFSDTSTMWSVNAYCLPVLSVFCHSLDPLRKTIIKHRSLVDIELCFISVMERMLSSGLRLIIIVLDK